MERAFWPATSAFVPTFFTLRCDTQAKPGPGINEPILWTTQFGMGRVFVTALGHDPDDTENPAFKITFLRGAEWAASGKVTIPVPPELAK